jgi:MerR family Zn(II)-responsive transcriptional regulator of zntA
MLIGELAEKTDIAPYTIRFYEKEGLIDERFFERGDNNYRYYAEAAVERIMMIKHGQAAGFTLSEIRELMETWDTGKLTVAEQNLRIQQKIEEVTGKIAELERLRRYLSDKLDRLYSTPEQQ